MKAKTLLILIAVTALLTTCQNPKHLREGMFRLVLIPDSTRPSHELPVNLRLERTEGDLWNAVISNAGEQIRISGVSHSADSLIMPLPVFEGMLRLARDKDIWRGLYERRSAGRTQYMPVYLEPGENRFDQEPTPPLFDPSGRWEVTVNPKSDHPGTQIGEFTLEGNRLTGTFLTVTGDYRFLEGMVSGNQFMLSGFDGAHALLFKAELADNGELVHGLFIGGPSWQNSWTAKRNPDAALPDASTLTYLKPGFERLEFTFPDLNGNPVSLSDPAFQNKVVIVQIIGSWCPNCMDETRFFAELYDRYRDDGLEIIALCYESADPEASVRAIKRFREGTEATYTFLYAGVAAKQEAGKTLPMLNRIISYPTSVFIDRNGSVQKILTGFSGPGTGEHYEKLTAEMVQIIETLLFVPLDETNRP